MRRASRIPALFLMFSVGFLWGGGEAAAATVTIWPDQFSVYNWDAAGNLTYQNPDTLNGNANYYFVLNIPAGNVIKFIRVNYNSPEGSGFGFDVYLKRKTPTTAAESLIEISAYPPDGTDSVQSDATHAVGPLAIKRGYRYYIELQPGVEGSINSIQVVY